MRKVQNERPLAGPLERLAELQPDLLAIGPDTRLTDVLTAIAETANDVLGGHFCVVFPYDQSSDTFIMEQVTAAGAPEAINFHWTRPIPSGTVRTALQVGVLIIEDCERDAERYPFLMACGPGAFKEVAEVRACIGIRLQAGGESVGVLFVNYPAPHHFSEEELRIAELFASQAALAIRSVRLYESEVRDRELAAVGERSGDIVHRLSNPAGAIRWRLERLREKKADLLDSDDYLARSLADIERNALKIQAMVRELRESTVEPLVPFEVWPLLTSALGRIEIPENIELIVSPDDRLPRVLSTRKLEDVFYNLMTNAAEAMADGGKLEITAEVKEQDWVEVSIRDTGQGIPEYLLEEIFKADFTTKGEEGHGLGLWWSRAFVEKCGGTIRVQSEVGKGSCFTVRLQVAR